MQNKVASFVTIHMDKTNEQNSYKTKDKSFQGDKDVDMDEHSLLIFYHKAVDKLKYRNCFQKLFS